MRSGSYTKQQLVPILSARNCSNFHLDVRDFGIGAQPPHSCLLCRISNWVNQGTGNRIYGTHYQGKHKSRGSLDPAFVAGIWQHHSVYWVAPILGAQLVVIAYQQLPNGFRDFKR